MNKIYKDRVKIEKNIVYHESAGGYLFCEENGLLYVALLKNIDGKYFMPKGHLKTNETPEQAAIREVKEELNLKVLPEKIAKVGIIEYSFNLDNGEKKHFKKVHIYVYRLLRKLEIKPLKDENYVDATWFEVKQAIRLLEYEKNTLAEAIKIYNGYKFLSEYLKVIVKEMKDNLGENLSAIIDSGSISSGGYKPGWSDIDLLIVVTRLDLNTKLNIAKLINKLRKKLDIDIGLNIISTSDFISPNFPVIRLAGKTLQALVEYSGHPERLLYSRKETRAFVPSKNQIKAYSLSNISYFVLLNRRELSSILITDKDKFKTLVGKQIRYSFIIMKLAIQYYKNVVYDTKQDTLFAAKEYFNDFNFDSIQKSFEKTENWQAIKSQAELRKILQSSNDFIESFSEYIFSGIN